MRRILTAIFLTGCVLLFIGCGLSESLTPPPLPVQEPEQTVTSPEAEKKETVEEEIHEEESSEAEAPKRKDR